MLTLNTDIPLNVAKLVKGKEEESMMYLFLKYVLARSRMNLIFNPFNEFFNSIENKYNT